MARVIVYVSIAAVNGSFEHLREGVRLVYPPRPEVEPPGGRTCLTPRKRDRTMFLSTAAPFDLHARFLDLAWDKTPQRSST
jgi:hypothetical protein